MTKCVDDDGNVRPTWTERRRDRRTWQGGAGLAALGGAQPDRPRQHHRIDAHRDALTGGHEPGPWRLDPLPQVISAADWEVLEAGLVQRSRFSDAILADSPGPACSPVSCRQNAVRSSRLRACR